MKKTVLGRVATLGVALVPLALLATTSSAATPSSVNVVGYSIVANAYTALETAFQHTLAGEGVSFANSFGASTTQAEDVVAGPPADVVNFSRQPDLQLLVDAHLVSRIWASYPGVQSQKGIVTDSTVAIVVRPGNPLGVNGWSDLLGSGVKIVTPDPISSGSARWNLLAAYESQIALGLKPAAAKTFLNSLIGNVVAEPSSGSKALSTFLAGTGNVLLAYEADAYPAQLSDGERQRMALARALAIAPRVLLLDEPFGALDAQVRTELRQWVKELHRQIHVTTILVTHDQDEAMEVADQLLIMHHGRIEQTGRPTDLYQRPSTPFVHGFLGPTTLFKGEVVRPHDLALLAPGHGVIDGTVSSITDLGFEVRVVVLLSNGSTPWVQLSRNEFDRLRLQVDSPVSMRERDRRLESGSALTRATQSRR